MKYMTQNELDHFDFSEAHITEVQMTKGFVHALLDNVKILPENSKNRDIRTMRCNELCLRLTHGEVVSLVKEGVKIYNPDGVLMREIPDQTLEPEAYGEVANALIDGSILSIEKKDEKIYSFLMDGTDDSTYNMTVAAEGDSQEWDRFLNLESF